MKTVWKVPFVDGKILDYVNNEQEYITKWERYLDENRNLKSKRVNIPIEWKENYEFSDTLRYKDFYHGRSAMNFTFIGTDTNTEYTISMNEFKTWIPYMVRGEVTGKFTFVKRGANIFLVKVATQK